MAPAIVVFGWEVVSDEIELTEEEESWPPTNRERVVGERGIFPRLRLLKRLAVEEGKLVVAVERETGSGRMGEPVAGGPSPS